MIQNDLTTKDGRHYEKMKAVFVLKLVHIFSQREMINALSYELVAHRFSIVSVLSNDQMHKVPFGIAGP